MEFTRVNFCCSFSLTFFISIDLCIHILYSKDITSKIKTRLKPLFNIYDRSDSAKLIKYDRIELREINFLIRKQYFCKITLYLITEN